jgi:hypothetical protein
MRKTNCFGTHAKNAGTNLLPAGVTSITMAENTNPLKLAD